MTSSQWIRDNGWWMATRSDSGTKATHLLLNGGKVCVPRESEGAFLSAYSIAVVKGVEPCVVELRTSVFRMFLDLDIKTGEDTPLDFEGVMTIIQTRASAFFDEDSPRAIVCVTDAKRADDGVKAGRHVVWTNVFATSSTALAFRTALIDDLEAALPGACTKPWTSVVDACVFQSNGLRMPFSAKGSGNSSTYVPSEVWTGTADVDRLAAPPSGVSATRHWVNQLSIRTFGVDETPVREGVEVELVDAGGGQDGLRGVARRMAEYDAVLPSLDASLPAQFDGHRFTGVIKTETCFLLRSSSQYCLNVDRKHTTSNVYFVLSPKGIRQKCYCRQETAEGRKHGFCKDFASETWPVAEEALLAFFGDRKLVSDPSAFQPTVLPSVKASLSSSGLEQLLSRSRPPLKAAKKRKK